MNAHPWTAVDHYENFPVGSWLVPARSRAGFVALYRFAREADDIADEGIAADSIRLAGLDRLSLAITHPGTGPDPDPECVARLHPFIASHGLAIADLLALLSAFRQDVHVHRYSTRSELLAYCERSANPIGHLVLKLFSIDDPTSLQFSDRVCTALQLINFLQDVAIDWRKGRVYLPQESLAKFGCTDHDIELAVSSGEPPSALRKVLAEEAEHAWALLFEGRPLLNRVPWRLALELRAIMAGGARMIEKIRQRDFNVFSRRPTLDWTDALALIRLSLGRAR